MTLIAQMAYAGSPSARFRHSSRAMSPLLNACSRVWKLFLIAAGIAITASSSSTDCQGPGPTTSAQNRRNFGLGKERRRNVRGRSCEWIVFPRDQVERFMFQTSDTRSHLILLHPKQVLVHFGLSLEPFI